MGRKKASIEKPTHVDCPFTILIDTQEEIPYEFIDIESNSDNGSLPFQVNTKRQWLQRLGDYSLILPESIVQDGSIPRCVIERKSKADFFGSMAKNENWENRLAGMCQGLDYAAIVVEAEWSDIMDNPYEWSKMPPKNMHRMFQSWTIEFSKVHWFFYPGREAAEVATFWLLYRFYEKSRKLQTDKHRRLENYEAYFQGMKANREKIPVTSNPHPRHRIIGDKADYWSRGWIDAADIHSTKTKGNRKCSDPPDFPECIFSSDYIRKEK